MYILKSFNIVTILANERERERERERTKQKFETFLENIISITVITFFSLLPLQLFL